ncbi:ybbR-like family protein [Clostridium sporogenes]|uniref:CdaR family protein n=1 Tax=Clostridium TaxID=1485 RepID=UPI00090BE487|nr:MULTISPECIES: CdaR family protein [Clostridium]APF27367.1 ybbR-like family protein [Clostridium sporogenes]MDI6920755.1 CdaR family protein [Clostridium botulinum]WMU97497.1 CdaR family protein [Clostridium botulinum]
MGKKSKTENIIVKICCIIASFALWLYIFNIENPIKEQKITVPVNIVNKKSMNELELALMRKEVNTVTLIIKGNVKDIYSVKAEDFKVEADLNSFGLKKGENKIPVKVKKSPGSIKIVNEENLWTKITLDKLKSKTVPIKIKVTGTPKDGYAALNPIIKEETATIYGTETYINKVKEVVGKCNIEGKSSEIKTNISLQAKTYDGDIINEVSVEPSKVYVKIPLTRIKRVPVNMRLSEDISNNKNIESITPLQSEVEISGEEEVIQNIKYIDTEMININSIKIGQENIESNLVVPKGVILVSGNNTIKLKVKFKVIEDKKEDEKNKDKEENKEDKIIEKKATKDINIINEPKDKEVLLSQSNVTINMKGNKDVIDKINVDNIKCYVDLKNVNLGENIVKVIVDMGDNKIDYSVNLDSIKVTVKEKQEE